MNTIFCPRQKKIPIIQKGRGTVEFESCRATMPPSQLKQLKASLRSSGVLGPQKSKKQKQRDAKEGTDARDRIQRNAALQSIREQFNPFEVKASTKRVKFDVTTRDDGARKAGGSVRPGVTKSLGEEKVRIRALSYLAMAD